MAKKQFKAESKRLLDLMINSIYTHKEIFLREIISNASDAIDKLVYTGLSSGDENIDRNMMQITLSVDKEERTLTVSDNGIGMNEQELEKNLGVIASSGSERFRKEMGSETEENGEKTTGLIGMFGVGFYSAFMVADEVEVITRKYGEEQAWSWVSKGADGYTITEAEKDSWGTDVIMHIREEAEEADEYDQYMNEYSLRRLVKKYSDYIRYPIRMLMPKHVMKEGSDPEKPEYEERHEYETLNSMKPLWHRKKSDVTDEEYNDFYTESFQDMEAPLCVIPVSAEGTVQYEALLFIPAKAPVYFGTEEYKAGLQLYSEGVKIMDRCEDLLPDYLNFVKGMVDSPDLSLNISRELLQHDASLKVIKNHLERKVKGELERMLKNDREKYEKFFSAFGRQLKICSIDNYGLEKDKLQDLLMFPTSQSKEHPVTLAEYVDRMPEDQKFIYYATGATLDNIDRLPQIEVLKERNIEIFYFADNVDQLVADMFVEYKDKKFRSAVDGDLELDNEKTQENEEKYAELLNFVKETLGDKVDTVKVSDKLKSHPVSLSSGEGVTFEMERYFNTMNPDMGVKAKRILELNVEHTAVQIMDSARAADEEKARKYAEILYNQACLIAGLPLEDPSGYTDMLVSLW